MNGAANYCCVALLSVEIQPPKRSTSRTPCPGAALSPGPGSECRPGVHLGPWATRACHQQCLESRLQRYTLSESWREALL